MSALASNLDILCISTTDWDEIWGSRQQLMLQMVARGHRVLFVERQVGPEHLLRNPAMRRRKLAAWKEAGPIQIQSNLWRWQPPLMPPGRYYSLKLNQWGQRRLSARLRPILQQLGFETPLLWTYPPHSVPLLGQFDEKLAIYHCIERFAGAQPGRKRQVMLAQEEALLRAVDQVFVHAQGLQALYTPLARKPIVLLPSAADIAHYQSTHDIHAQMQAIPHPRLVVMGTLDARLDRDLLLGLAAQKPHWQLVLIGQTRAGQQKYARLLEKPNVHYLGKQPFASLPALLNGADAALIPYLLNEMTHFISPLKAYEYLAVGKPIISVDLPEVRTLQPWVQIVAANDDAPKTLLSAFIQTIATALETDTPEQQTRY